MEHSNMLLHTVRPLEPGEAEVAALVGDAAGVAADAAADLARRHAGGRHVLLLLGVHLGLLEIVFITVDNRNINYVFIILHNN